MTTQRNNAGTYSRGFGGPSTPKPQARTTNVAPAARPAEEPNAYLRTKVLTASPAELRLMLIDGAIRFTEQAREGLLSRNYEQSFEGFSKARAIVTELISGLNPNAGAELYERLTGLYTFIFTRLVDASSERSVEIIDEILDLFRFERETWVMLIENLASENTSAASVTEVPGVTPSDLVRDPDRPDEIPVVNRISTTG